VRADPTPRDAVREGVRDGSPTRGFPPGSAQALVALVLGLLAAVVGVQRGDHLLAVVFLGVAVLGGLGLLRLVRSRRR
jgi:Flp pilus assembly protein TadB